MSKEVDFPNNKTVFEGQLVRVAQNYSTAGHQNKYILKKVTDEMLLFTQRIPAKSFGFFNRDCHTEIRESNLK